MQGSCLDSDPEMARVTSHLLMIEIGTPACSMSVRVV